MPRKPDQLMTASAAARALGISLDTLRRWDNTGRISTVRDAANRRMVSASEVARLSAKRSSRLSARNQLEAEVTSIEIEGLLAQVEMVVQRGNRVVAVITRDSALALGLKPGANVRAVIKATSVLIER